MRVVKVSRRTFVKITSAASAGLVLGLQLPRKSDAATVDELPLGTFVHVGNDGIVTIYVSKSDMGQGVRTALPMIVADEMDADWSKVRIRQADLDKKWGHMGTGGSSSVRTMWTPMRQAGATARAMLVAAAAKQWSVDPKEIAVARGVVSHGARKATFGELAPAAAKIDVPKDVALKDPSKFTIIGRKADRLDNPDLVVGKSHYGIDVRLPGMLYAAVLRSPVFGGKVASVDDTKAKAVRGVKHIVKIDARGPLMPWSGVGVIADSTWAAMKGRDALAVTWDKGAAANESTASQTAQLHERMTGAGERLANHGDVDAALASAAAKVDATYEVPFLAHATMEPMNATASVSGDSLELWLPTQFADWVAAEAGQAVGVPADKVKVHVTLLGGGFGRRAFPDAGVEAAILSKAAGAPVKVQWTREDDMQHDYYRPAAAYRFVGGLDADGKLTALHMRMSSYAINTYLGRGKPGEDEADGIYNTNYVVPNLRFDYAVAESSVPRGWWRSVESSMNAFAFESALDELAHAAKKDPIEFRLAMLPEKPASTKEFSFDPARFRRVMELAREKSSWGKPLPAGRARGFAAYYSFRSYVAEVAEVSLEGGTPRVHRVTAVADVGTPVNPDGIAAQIEGGIVYGLTAALNGAITIDGGAVQQSNFHDYSLLTIAEMPVIETFIVPSTEPPTGIGEPGTPPIAPAVTNALFALTGKRVRKLPVKL